MKQNWRYLPPIMLVLLLASDSFSQTAYNALGIYTDPNGDLDSRCFSAIVGEQFTAYLVLTNPINDEFDGGQNTARPIQLVSGFECRITMPTSAAFFALSESYAVEDFTECQECRPNYVVSFATAVPVIDNSVVLATWTMLTLTPGTFDIFMTASQWPAQLGSLSVVDAEDPQQGRSAVTTSIGDELVPVFIVNEITGCSGGLPTDAQSWGHIKSIYR